MRTREEVERALHHLEHAMMGGALAGESDKAAQQLGPVIDVLRWVLGQPSHYEKTARECEEIEKQCLARHGGAPPAN